MKKKVDYNPIGNEESKDEHQETAPPSKMTCSGQTIKPPHCYNLFTQGHRKTEYSIETAMVIDKAMNNLIMHLLKHTKTVHLVNPK
jgi:hypothetical protein